MQASAVDREDIPSAESDLVGTTGHVEKARNLVCGTGKKLSEYR